MIFPVKTFGVLGGAGYLGQSTVELLVKLGAHVVCVDLPGRAEAFVAAKSLTNTVTPVSLDATNAAETKAFVSTHLQQRGVPHGLVNMTCAVHRQTPG